MAERVGFEPTVPLGTQARCVKPEGDKIVRLEAQSAEIEAGHVLLPESAPWLGDFLGEILAFPSSLDVFAVQIDLSSFGVSPGVAVRSEKGEPGLHHPFEHVPFFDRVAAAGVR